MPTVQYIYPHTCISPSRFDPTYWLECQPCKLFECWRQSLTSLSLQSEWGRQVSSPGTVRCAGHRPPVDCSQCQWSAYEWYDTDVMRRRRRMDHHLWAFHRPAASLVERPAMCVCVYVCACACACTCVWCVRMHVSVWMYICMYISLVYTCIFLTASLFL